jgi:hypothetical protein
MNFIEAKRRGKQPRKCCKVILQAVIDNAGLLNQPKFLDEDSKEGK